jgi:hypothetical protein
MKKTVLTRFIKTACCTLIMLTMALIINSCRKDTKLIGQQTNSVEADSHFAVTDAKAWFGNNKTTLATKIKLTSDRQEMIIHV